MNCLLYARVSTDKQAQKDLSIPAQIDAMKDYARINGWKVTGHFVDEGESARTVNRPELKNLLAYCKDHKDVNVVIVHKIDRLARNLVDYGTIKAILKQKGIRLVSVSEPFEDNPVGNLLENIIASMSEWYSANLGEEIKKSSRAKLMKGEWPQKPPFGYKSVKGENNRPAHVPDPETALLVRQAFELFSGGNYSLKTLAEEMYDRGMRTRLNKVLTRELMKKVLSRKFYIGRLEWNGKVYNGKHEPIVSDELFYRVQEVLKKRGIDTGEKGRLKFLLRGLTYCKVCGQKVTAEIHPRGTYYRCLPDYHGCKCDQPYIPVEHLDNQLVRIYRELQPEKDVLELLMVEMKIIIANRRQTAEKDISRLKKTLEDLEEKELKLLDEMLAGKVERLIYEKMQKRYTEQKTQAEIRLSQLQVDYKDPLDFLEKCVAVSNILVRLHQEADFEGQKNLLKAIFERIEVQDRTIVSYKLNQPFSTLLDKDIVMEFKDRPFRATERDVIEQVLSSIPCELQTIILGIADVNVNRKGTHCDNANGDHLKQKKLACLLTLSF